MSGPSKLWTTLFLIWAVFLSGAASHLTGSPGLFQYYQLKGLLSERQETLASLESHTALLKKTAYRLENEKGVQEREIRKVLGYAGSGELFFDFRPSNSTK